MTNDTEEQSEKTVEQVGALLTLMLSEGIVEDTPLGLKACAALEAMGLVAHTADELVDGAKYLRLHFTPAGRLARGDDTVAQWQPPITEDDIALARAIDELQAKLNFELPARDSEAHEPWSRAHVISLVVARQRLRPSVGYVAPRAILVEDGDGDTIERMSELLAVDLDYHLPDRDAAMRALRDRCVPWDRSGIDLINALEHVGLARRSRTSDGRTDLIELDLTSVGTALLTAIGKGSAPW